MSRTNYSERNFEKLLKDAKLAFGVVFNELPWEVISYSEGWVAVPLPSGAIVTVSVGEYGGEVREGSITFFEIESEQRWRSDECAVDLGMTEKETKRAFEASTNVANDGDALSWIFSDEFEELIEYVSMNHPTDVEYVKDLMERYCTDF